MFNGWGTGNGWTVGNGATFHVQMNVAPAPAPPKCECGAVATTAIEYVDGRRVPACVPCQERTLREDAIKNAKHLMSGLFCAVGVTQRARLYKQLAVVFHPDQGGDERLMTILNDVRKAFPG